jgi:hypothetical protein
MLNMISTKKSFLTKILQNNLRSVSNIVKAFATIDPEKLGPQDKGYNLVNGEWVGTEKYIDLVDPLNGGTMIKIPDT